jgi:hypothetical protein
MSARLKKVDRKGAFDYTRERLLEEYGVERDFYLGACMKDDKELNEAEKGRMARFERLCKIGDIDAKSLKHLIKKDLKRLSSSSKDRMVDIVVAINENLEAAANKTAENYVNAIDISKPMFIREIPAGSVLLQWNDSMRADKPGGKSKPRYQGSFYTFYSEKISKKTTIQQLGAADITTPGIVGAIDSKGVLEGLPEATNRQPFLYYVRKPVWSLMSISNEANDTWSVPGISIHTPGGHAQLYINNKENVELAGPEHRETLANIIIRRFLEKAVLQRKLAASSPRSASSASSRSSSTPSPTPSSMSSTQSQSPLLTPASSQASSRAASPSPSTASLSPPSSPKEKPKNL